MTISAIKFSNNRKCLLLCAHEGLTEQEILSQAILFLLAGYETTATTLTFLTHSLALNPECQDKLYNEVHRVVGDKVSRQP